MLNRQFAQYFHFLRFALGIETEAPADMDWPGLFAFAKRQTLLGVVFDGVQRIPKEKAPDEKLLMMWVAASMQIRRQNAVVNRASVEVFQAVRSHGLRCCILKGQGNALLYPNPAGRMPGDVDVWVMATREEIREVAGQLVAEGYKMGEESLNHIEMTNAAGISVELHSTPAIVNNPVFNGRVQKWLLRVGDLQCSNVVRLQECGEIAVPTAAFNAVYQLIHLYHHFFYEGVGLRQIVDYYLNIERLKDGNTSDIEKWKYLNIEILQRDLKWLGLWEFAGAVMYVLHVVLGLPEDRMIRSMDARRGKLLLEEILKGGNFGKFDRKKRFATGSLGHNIQRIKRDWRLVRYYPAEAICEPGFRLWHFLWRKFI